MFKQIYINILYMAYLVISAYITTWKIRHIMISHNVYSMPLQFSVGSLQLIAHPCILTR